MKRTLILLCLLAGIQLARVSSLVAANLDGQQVAAALMRAGIRISASQVEMLGDANVSHADPALQVQSAAKWINNRMKIKLRCQHREECLPFYVLVNWPSHDETVAVIDRWFHRVPGAAIPGPAQQEPWLVSRGESATLILESEHLHIQLPVVCLANARKGAFVRVRSIDNKKTFLAEVIGNKLLKGGL
jgi:hypothetical protein